jgi:chloramphenicol 3-O phosphotransferase
MDPVEFGRIVVLNGVSRSGKSRLARTIQETIPGIWMHLGMDAHKSCTPPCRQPGVGLRPGRGQVPIEIEAAVPTLYAALYESVAAHSRLGLDVVMDVNHHESYSAPYGILGDCARRLSGLPVLFVGVRCPIAVIWQRRALTWGQVPTQVDAGIIAAVELAQVATHSHGTYDLEVDTSTMNPIECAEVIRRRLMSDSRGSAFPKLAVPEEA